MKNIAPWLPSLLVGLSALSAQTVQAQGGATVGFRNQTQGPIIIQGVSVVNNMPRRGQPVLVLPGRVAFDLNVPNGVRIVNIYDAQQPSRVLLADFTLPIQSRELALRVRPAREAGRVTIVPDNSP